MVQTDYKGKKRAREEIDNECDADCEDKPFNSITTRATEQATTEQSEALAGQKRRRQHPQIKGVADPRIPRKDNLGPEHIIWKPMSSIPTIETYEGYYPCPLPGCEYTLKLKQRHVQSHLLRYHAHELPEDIELLCRQVGNKDPKPRTVLCLMHTKERKCVLSADMTTYGTHLLGAHWELKGHRCTVCGEEFHARNNTKVADHLETCRVSGTSSFSQLEVDPSCDSVSPSEPGPSKKRRLA